MLITFKEIQRRVQSRIQNTSTTTDDDNNILPKVKDWINERYDRIYRVFPWPGTIDTYDLTLTASTSGYVFEREVFKVWKIFDKTNGYPIIQDNLQNHIRQHALDLEVTGNIITGDPKRWRPIGTHTVKAAVGSTGEAVDIVSSSASDVSPQAVRIKGLVNGVLIGEEIDLTGTTTATSTTTWDASQKLRITTGTNDGTRKSIVGKVTISGNTSSTTFAEIAPQEFAHQYHWLRVSPQPKATGTQPTWEIWHSIPLEHLDDNNDIPIMDCANELVQGAFADALREDGLEQEANIAEEKWVAMVHELINKEKDPDEIEQFTPYTSEEAFRLLDYGRLI